MACVTTANKEFWNHSALISATKASIMADNNIRAFFDDYMTAAGASEAESENETLMTK